MRVTKTHIHNTGCSMYNTTAFSRATSPSLIVCLYSVSQKSRTGTINNICLTSPIHNIYQSSLVWIDLIQFSIVCVKHF